MRRFLCVQSAFGISCFEGRKTEESDEVTMFAATKKTEASVEHSADGARFEPVKKILMRCDEKTIECARSMKAIAA